MYFIFGACCGSFFHVCSYRIPKGLSIVYPGSRCPKCKSDIAWYDNIPIFSWLLLRAKCRKCAFPIPGRYVIFEVLFGLASWFLFRELVEGPADLTTWAWTYALFCWLAVLSQIDIELRILPDVLTMPPIFVAALWGYVELPLVDAHSWSWQILLSGFFLLFAAFMCLRTIEAVIWLAWGEARCDRFTALLIRSKLYDDDYGKVTPVAVILFAILFAAMAWIFPRDLTQSEWGTRVLGSMLGLSLFYVSGKLASAILRDEALGMGDVKFVFCLGFLLGHEALLVGLFFATIVASLAGFLAYLQKGDKHIPFGPYLALGAILAHLYHPDVIFIASVLFGL